MAGVAAYARPDRLARFLGSDRGTASRAEVYVRLFAAREIALGLGTLNALRSGADVRPWVLAAAVGDAGDAVAFASAARARSVGAVRGLAVTAFATAGVAGAVLAVRALRER
ncbi:MAG: hypothetical protein QOH89_3796 [Pseudonocardiales bacterium]|nr:hypothetical protein [Pseudonocardiales bacterium]